MQLIVKTLGGDVARAEAQEYGRMDIVADCDSALFGGSDAGGEEPEKKKAKNESRQTVWMSHGDEATKLPEGFRVVARSDQGTVVAIECTTRKIFGLQYHPEVTHTPRGMETLRRVVFDIGGAHADWQMQEVLDEAISAVQAAVGPVKHAVCALSGGVDSTVAATLVHRAIGDRLHCIFVDNGLLRFQEQQRVMAMFEADLHLPVTCVDASDRFLSKLRGVTDPEKKRRIIGAEFIGVFDDFASELEAKLGHRPECLVQGGWTTFELCRVCSKTERGRERKRRNNGAEFIGVFDDFASELEAKLGHRPECLVQGGLAAGSGWCDSLGLKQGERQGGDVALVLLFKLRGVMDPKRREGGASSGRSSLECTLYPDVIESCPPPGSGKKHSHTIKSHHNVGGLPENMRFTLVEPLKWLFKDEVEVKERRRAKRGAGGEEWSGWCARLELSSTSPPPSSPSPRFPPPRLPAFLTSSSPPSLPSSLSPFAPSQVRKIGALLNVPASFLSRHPFPLLPQIPEYKKMTLFRLVSFSPDFSPPLGPSQVRKIGALLNVPASFLSRHPFPLLPQIPLYKQMTLFRLFSFSPDFSPSRPLSGAQYWSSPQRPPLPSSPAIPSPDLALRFGCWGTCVPMGRSTLFARYGLGSAAVYLIGLHLLWCIQPCSSGAGGSVCRWGTRHHSPGAFNFAVRVVGDVCAEGALDTICLCSCQKGLLAHAIQCFQNAHQRDALSAPLMPVLLLPHLHLSPLSSARPAAPLVPLALPSSFSSSRPVRPDLAGVHSSPVFPPCSPCSPGSVPLAHSEHQVDEIFINSIKEAGLYDQIWQAFAVFLPVRSVGVQGDRRTHSHVVALRAITSQDGMTADW
ncbi:unnamed protein product [Closterium sp. Naga37s-1]|nr:unnamed protein product [Closterium sp. Naga37s-1]